MSRLEGMKAGRITILKKYLGDGWMKMSFTEYSFYISLLLLIFIVFALSLHKLYVHAASDLHTYVLNN